MSLKRSEINKRWKSIRKNPECELSLSASSVASMVQAESELVKARILETLVQLAQLRLERGGFINDEPDAAGDLVTSEGLEAFLVPAVEETLSFSEVLEEIERKSESLRPFADAICHDIEELLEDWCEGVFEGSPYAPIKNIEKALDPVWKGTLRPVSTTEAAAMSCRVVLHLLVLKQQKGQKEKLFNEFIGSRLDRERLYTALEKSIRYLVSAFQRSPGASAPSEALVESPEDPWDLVPSGWSWAAWQGLPPILFFTSWAVDAFAEVDLYLIRKCDKEYNVDGPWPHLETFYSANRSLLDAFDSCAELARKWVSESVLPYMSVGYGTHVETALGEEFADDEAAAQGTGRRKPRKGQSNTWAEDIPLYPPVLDRVRMPDDGMTPALLYYKNLYALLVLLWTFSDWDDQGGEKAVENQSRIQRALFQIVHNYRTYPALRSALNRLPYVFDLPGGHYFSKAKKADCSYLDWAYLPLMSRILVLYLAYGVGDQLVFEPLIRELTVELMMNRNRENPDYPFLWAEDEVQVFATSRAVQALTFFNRYLKGKERADRPSLAAGELEIRNRTGLPIRLELNRAEDAIQRAETTEDAEPSAEEHPPAPENFAAYCGGSIRPVLAEEKDEQELIVNVEQLAEDVIAAWREGPYMEVFVEILEAIKDIRSKPNKDGQARDKEYRQLRKRFEQALA